MIRKSAFFGVLSLLFSFLSAKAQDPSVMLDKWSARTPIEKIYVQTDREDYLPGENIWFKAYLSSDYLPDTISTSIYIELSNTSGQILNRKVFPAFYGTANGQVELADTLTSGTYFLRAYTATQLNFDTAYLWNRKIMVHGKKNGQPTSPRTHVLSIRFFPEGGNFVAGMLNTIAFKASNEYGSPEAVSGQIKNSRGEAVAGFSTTHEGMGMFDLTPAAGETYYAEPDQYAGTRRFDLPAPAAKGVVLRVMPDPGGKYYDIMQHSNDPDQTAAYLIGQMQHHVVYRQVIRNNQDWITGVIPTAQFPSGIMQVTVFNASGIPLAERLTFIDNQEYRLKATLQTDTLNFGTKGYNHLSVTLPDSVVGSFSVSVTDPDYNISGDREQHIISALLLTDDLKGYVHDPAYYFSSDEDPVKNALDLLLMTQGWRRFTWNKLAELSATKPAYKDASFITVSGKINLRDSKRPVSDRDLLMMFTSGDSVNTHVQFMHTGPDGAFGMDSLIFYGKTRVMISDIVGKKNKWIDIYPGPDSINRSFPLTPFDWRLYPQLPGSGSDSARLMMSAAYDAYLKANGTMLQGVTVKGVRKTVLQELDDKYTSGIFSGLAHKTLDLVHNASPIISRNIFDYIQSKIAGVRVVENGSNITVYYRQTTSLTSIAGIPMILYLDEMQTDAAMIATIPPSQVAMVKVYNFFPGAEGNGANGVLAIYTKKPDDLTSVFSSSTDFFNYEGYSVQKEFYVPDYAGADSNKTYVADNRITLHWRPDIFVNNSDPKIPVIFFNNDRTKRFRIVMEGMTWDGRLLFFEKIINGPSPKAF